jgi:hypothetical protein
MEDSRIELLLKQAESRKSEKASMSDHIGKLIAICESGLVRKPVPRFPIFPLPDRCPECRHKLAYHDYYFEHQDVIIEHAACTVCFYEWACITDRNVTRKR